MNNKSYLFACFLRARPGLSLDFPPRRKRGEVGGNLAGNFEDDDRGGGRGPFVVANESKIFISGEISDLDKIRKNLPRRNCRRSNQSRNCVPCLEISADKGRKRERERDKVSSRIALPFRRTHAYATCTTHAKVARINLVPHCHMPYPTPPSDTYRDGRCFLV